MVSLRAYLVLENSMAFEGRPFGSPVGPGVVGEVVFTTGMTGYLETLTDPSYYGQIILQTFPRIGNYGVIPADFESSRVQPRGYIVREWCRAPSNFRSEGDVDSFLAREGIVGLCGVDTRAITRIIRERGVMNGAIVSDPKDADMDAVKRYAIRDSVANVSVKEPYVVPASGEARFRVVLWDFGAKGNIAKSLASRGCEVTVMPHGCPSERIEGMRPDGVMLCNGPGDPADNPGIIRELKKLTETGIPIFGICLGHQLLALAMGARTERLKYGHRGANQPVRDLKTGLLYISTQNHGYIVVPDSIPPDVADLRYANANDGTCEGLDYKNIPAFTVQFHPEAAAGPLDTGFLFDRFTDMMGERKHAQK
jgi:carbamoyl-phosphate synthase small subunit